MKTAVATLSVGDQGREMLEISGPLLKAYADRIGARYHVFRVAESEFPCGEKFRVRDAVAHYDRTIFLDADVIVSPNCPSLFDVVPPGHVSAHDDAVVGARHGVLASAQRESDILCDSQGRARRKVDKCYNSGVLVLDREHAGFFDPPTKPFPHSHCMEQWWEWLNVLEYGYKTFDLPSVFNYQWWYDRRMPSIRERPDVMIRHFSGMSFSSDHANRLAAMRGAVRDIERAGEPLPVAPLPDGDYESPGMESPRPDAAFPNMVKGDPAACGWPYLRREIPHNWYVDRRFPTVGFVSRDEAAILHTTAKRFTGQFAVEIGCWFGWSACHLAMGGVGHLDVYDPILSRPVFRASVDASLIEAGVADRVTLHPESSPGGLAGTHPRSKFRPFWSLAFIDGDHDGSAPTLDAMAVAARAMPDAMVLFHDAMSPSVGAALDELRNQGWKTAIYNTAQIIGVAWRGATEPVPHTPDPSVVWTIPAHLRHHAVVTAAGPV